MVLGFKPMRESALEAEHFFFATYRVSGMFGPLDFLLSIK